MAILLLFPTGHLPNRRWSTVVWLSAAGSAILATGFALDPDTGQYFVGGRNPYAAPGLLTLGAVALVAALVAAVNRLRRSSGVERQQMKWFAWPAASLLRLCRCRRRCGPSPRSCTRCLPSR